MIGDVFLRIMDVGFGVSLLLAAVCALRFFLRSSPSWMMRALWALVALRLLFPFYVEVPYEGEREEGTAAIEQLAPERMSELVYGEQRVSTYEQELTSKTESAQVEGVEIGFKEAVPYLWLAVSVGVLSVGLIRYALLKRKVRFAYPADKGVFEAENIGNSFVFGIIRPKIIFPAGTDVETERFALLHERVHIRRLDNLWRLLGVTVCAVHFFNPIAWVCLRYFLMDMEHSADEAVIRALNEDERADYARALLEHADQGAVFSSAFGGAALRGRLENIISYKEMTKLSTVCVIVFAILLVVVLITNSI